MSRDPGAKVRHGFGVKGGLAVYPANGWGAGARAGIAIEQEPEESRLAPPVAVDERNNHLRTDAARLLFDPAPLGPQEAFTPIDDPIEDTSHFSNAQRSARVERLQPQAARLLFDPTLSGPLQTFTPIDGPEEDTSHFNGLSAAQSSVAPPLYVLPHGQQEGTGMDGAAPDRLEQLRRAFWLLSRHNDR